MSSVPYLILRYKQIAGCIVRRCLCWHTQSNHQSPQQSWAPRSSRQWRLRPVPGEAITKADLPDDDVDLLQQLRQRQEALGSTVDTAGVHDDSDLHRSPAARYTELGGAPQSDAFAPTTPLTGAVLQELVLAKYGMQYDLSIVKRDIPGRTLVRLNVMWQHTKQVSFAMSPREFDEKMETIAYYLRYAVLIERGAPSVLTLFIFRPFLCSVCSFVLISDCPLVLREKHHHHHRRCCKIQQDNTHTHDRAWQQEEVVRDFFSKPPRPSRGLPARPVPGSAVSIKLDVDQIVVEEWFGGQ